MDRHYRVIRQETPSGKTEYVVYQVYYDEQGNIALVSSDPASPSRETVSELKVDLERVRQALDLPVLEGEDVLNSLELSGATAYGKWLREQVLESSDDDEGPGETTISHEEISRAEQRKREKFAEVFAEKRRKDPSFGL